MMFWAWVVFARRLPIRGGNWNNGANAGVFYMNLNNVRSNSDNNIGFRVASLLKVLARRCLSHGMTSRAESKGIQALVALFSRQNN